MPNAKGKSTVNQAKDLPVPLFPPSRLRQRLLRISWSIYTRLSLDHLDLLHRIHLDFRFPPLPSNSTVLITTPINNFYSNRSFVYFSPAHTPGRGTRYLHLPHR